MVNIMCSQAGPYSYPVVPLGSHRETSLQASYRSIFSSGRVQYSHPVVPSFRATTTQPGDDPSSQPTSSSRHPVLGNLGNDPLSVQRSQAGQHRHPITPRQPIQSGDDPFGVQCSQAGQHSHHSMTPRQRIQSGDDPFCVQRSQAGQHSHPVIPSLQGNPSNPETIQRSRRPLRIPKQVHIPIQYS